MERNNKDTTSKIDFERWKMEHASNLAKYNAENACNLEMFKSVILVGQGALKSVILINGGAAVALLAFISTTWYKSADPVVAKKLLISMILFVLGVLSGGVASGFTYLSQQAYAKERIKLGNVLLWLIVILVVVAYIYFLVASGVAFWAFWEHLPNGSSCMVR